MRTVAIGLLFGAILLAEWACGRLPLGVPTPDNLLAELLLERMHPWAAQALVGLMLLAATVIGVLPRSVMLVPARGLSAVLFAFWIWIGLSLTQTQHFHLSLLELSRWTLNLVAVQVVLATVGRMRLPSVVLGVVVAGAALVALSGIQEYLSPGTQEGWRIFAGWHNPNAAASLFALVLPPALALVLAVRGSSGRALALLGVAVICAALFLTASKGGLISAALGVVGFVVVSAAVAGHRVRWVPLAAALAVSVAASLGVVGLKSLTAPERGSATRLLAAGEEAQQSFAFRRQVWTETRDMIAERPLLGFGMGTYAPEFKRFSQVQAPVLAHNSYLQLAAEAGVPAVLLFLAFGVLYLLHVARRHPGEGCERTLLRSGCVGAAFAAGANAAVDSTFSISGYGLVFFVIVAVGLILSADGAQPEKAPLNSRAIAHTLPAAGATAYLVIGFLSTHLIATARAQQSSDAGAAARLISLAMRIAPADPGPLEARAELFGKSNSAVAAACWQSAARLSPTPSRWAEAARLYHRSGDLEAALSAARAAIQAEPSNPRWRAIELQILRDAGRVEEAVEVAENMVRMEQTLFFTLRSLPWLVELSTVEARIFLADLARDKGHAKAEAEQLEGAYRLLRAYRLSTLPELLRQTGMDEVIAKRIELEQAKAHEPLLGDVAEALQIEPSDLLAYIETVARLPLAGESLVKARANVEQLELVGGRLAEVYETLGRLDAARKLRKEVSELSWQRLRLGFGGL